VEAAGAGTPTLVVRAQLSPTNRMHTLREINGIQTFTVPIEQLKAAVVLTDAAGTKPWEAPLDFLTPPPSGAVQASRASETLNLFLWTNFANWVTALPPPHYVLRRGTGVLTRPVEANLAGPEQAFSTWSHRRRSRRARPPAAGEPNPHEIVAVVMPAVLASLPPSRLPLLITGISGVAGYGALFHFQARYPGRVIGIRPPVTFRLTGPGIVALEAEDEAGLEALFRTHRFRSVLSATGNCALKPCELNPELAHRANVASARAIARLARDWGARLVHLSSDLVFSGKGHGGYVETDPTDPVTVYGRTMALGEQEIFSRCPGAAILRISLPMGVSFNGHAGAIDWIQSRFRAGRPATLYFDEVRSCTYVDDLSAVCEHFLATDAAGLFHAGGPRALTLYQIAQVVNRVGGYEPHLLHGIPRREAGPLPPRAGNVSMNSGKLHALLGGDPFQPWPLGTELLPTDRRWHCDRPPGEPNGPQRLRERLYRYTAILTTCQV
jgi:dTDP-4-dehydrorhamnose reductase